MLVGLGLISLNQVTNRRWQTRLFVISLLGGGDVHVFALLWSQIQGHAPYTRTLEWAAAGNHLNMGYTIDHLTV